MKTYLYALALTLMLLFLADTKIVLWPFSISFGRGWLALGTILIIAGCLCLFMQWYGDGLKKGVEIKHEVIDEKIKETI